MRAWIRGTFACNWHKYGYDNGMARSNPTLGEIAEHSGVSTATVSRVLSRSGSVSRSLVEKVNLSLRELGFKRDTQGLIGLLVPDYGSMTVFEKLEGVESEAERLGYSVVPIHVGNSQAVREKNLQLLKLLDFDALIILKDGIDPAGLRKQFQLGEIPMVVVNHRVDAPGIHCIDIDREIAMYKAMTYLVSLGHRRIAYFSAPLDTSVATARKRGVDRAVAESGAEIEMKQAPATLEMGYQMTGSILAGGDWQQPTAIVTFDDLVAMGVLGAARAHGRRVPIDLSVVGFDDLFISRHSYPPLTTVHQPWLQMGQLAVKKVDDILAGRDRELGGLTILESPLIVRESTGPPPA